MASQHCNTIPNDYKTEEIEQRETGDPVETIPSRPNIDKVTILLSFSLRRLSLLF
ncbi:hypothetical protein [Pasteuria penetrans]|uniref:hypothetical protein n=1 Tax=Pasteuria penetrans TaxID=86005 RepID=UPI000FBFF4DF|nr:hypothetical protein [Pasteuria penetrans]